MTKQSFFAAVLVVQSLSLVACSSNATGALSTNANVSSATSSHSTNAHYSSSSSAQQVNLGGLPSSLCTHGVAGTPLTYAGQTYRTVVIGGKTWMGENLNVVPTQGFSICYDNNPGNCSQLGRLFDWTAAQVACPSGWHLPDTSEYAALVSLLGGSDLAKTKLRASFGWSNGSFGTDDIGFCGIAAGDAMDSTHFGDVGTSSYFMTTSSDESSSIWVYAFSLYSARFIKTFRVDGNSVRCIKDAQ